MPDLYREHGLVRTDVYCHSCTKNFIARINFDLDGQHEIECPYCGHLHYRMIKAGVVTNDRYQSDSTTHKVARRDLWKATAQPIMTNTASAFIRDRWLNREG
jgi:DNA-directed RNA polymerase subunit RPC12/RpoP